MSGATAFEGAAGLLGGDVLGAAEEGDGAGGAGLGNGGLAEGGGGAEEETVAGVDGGDGVKGSDGWIRVNLCS